MANAMKCDRCGKYYDFYGNFNESEPDGMAFTSKRDNVRIKITRRYDLCLDCLQELDEFMRTISEKEKGDENDGSDQGMR